jgi:leader peptidase (prepilin peptidase) / N-methyltransferase
VTPMVWITAVVVGLVVGSFLNVVISRLPARRSLWGPRSECPTCGTAIAWHDNIPVLSFVALKRRCRACAVPIPWRYLIVEVVTAGLFVGACARLPVGVQLVGGLAFLAMLIAITGIDLDHQIIPDAITLPGILTGALVSLASDGRGWLDSLLGVAIGGGIFFVIILASGGGMGGGDMKLGAMLGAFLGWKLTLVAIFIAVIAGGVLAAGVLVAGRKSRKDAIPFGPFLALGGAVALFWGPTVLTWYLNAFAG